MLEPYVGYAFSGGGDDTTVTGPMAGLRTGLTFPLGLQVGAEYFRTSQNLEVDGSDTDVDYEQSGVGAFVGFDAPVLPIRFWGTYFFDSEVELDPSIGIPGLFTLDKYTEGSGYKVGVGFTGLPFLSINLEWQSIAYDAVEINGTSVDITDGGDFETILLSVSLPLP